MNQRNIENKPQCLPLGYLSRQLKDKEVYLGIGIGKGRPWAQDVQEEKKIYNLAISILTIPDYAGMRTYYDFEKMLGRQF